MEVAAKELIRVAQQIWEEYFDPPRVQSRRRVHRGRPQGLKPGGFAAMLRCRRREAQAAIEQGPSNSESIDATAAKAKRKAGAAFTERMEKELSFNRKKRRHHFLDSLNSGHLLEDEYGPRDEEEAQAHRGMQEKAQETTTKKHARLQGKMPCSRKRSFEGLPFWLDAGVPRRCALRHHLLQKEKALVVAPLDAEVFVVADPTKAPQRVVWITALRGGVVASPLWASSRGAQGDRAYPRPPMHAQL